MKSCTCNFNCADDPRTACGLNGAYHVHTEDGACPAHPNAQVVWNG